MFMSLWCEPQEQCYTTCTKAQTPNWWDGEGEAVMENLRNSENNAVLQLFLKLDKIVLCAYPCFEMAHDYNLWYDKPPRLCY